MAGLGVRHLVDDVAAASACYTGWVSFTVEFDAAPGSAALTRGEPELLLDAVGGQGRPSQPMPDGTVAGPGGSNRSQLFEPAS